MEKQMRIELANEYPGGDGYYYASLELPAEEYEIRDALQKIRAVGRDFLQNALLLWGLKKYWHLRL